MESSSKEIEEKIGRKNKIIIYLDESNRNTKYQWLSYNNMENITFWGHASTMNPTYVSCPLIKMCL